MRLSEPDVVIEFPGEYDDYKILIPNAVAIYEISPVTGGLIMMNDVNSISVTLKCGKLVSARIEHHEIHGDQIEVVFTDHIVAGVRVRRPVHLASVAAAENRGWIDRLLKRESSRNLWGGKRDRWKAADSPGAA